MQGTFFFAYPESRRTQSRIDGDKKKKKKMGYLAYP